MVRLGTASRVYTAVLGGMLGVVFLGACNGPVIPGIQDMDQFHLSSSVRFSGPLPVFQDYDGTNPIVPEIHAGLFNPGTSVINYYLNYYQVSYDPWDVNLSGNFNLDNSIDSYILDAGTYDLGFYAATDPVEYGQSLGYPGYVVLARGPQVKVDYSQDGVALEQMNVNFTGPGPYGAVSGRFLISGNPGLSASPQLVFDPVQPLAGLDQVTGLVWTISTDAPPHGQAWFTVTGLSYGDYELSYAGYSLRDRDNPLAVSSLPVTFNAAQPDKSGITFQTTNSLPEDQAWELGRIKGTLRLPAPPAPGSAYCVTASRSTSGGDSGTLGEIYDTANWIATAADFDQDSRASFDLGWLIAGTYTFTVVELGTTPEDEPVAHGPLGSATLVPGEHEVTGIEIEVGHA